MKKAVLGKIFLVAVGCGGLVVGLQAGTNSEAFTAPDLMTGGTNPTYFYIKAIHLGADASNPDLAFTVYTSYLNIQQMGEAFKQAQSIDPSNSKISGLQTAQMMTIGVIGTPPHLLANFPAPSSLTSGAPGFVPSVSPLSAAQGNSPGCNLSGPQAVGAAGAQWYAVPATLGGSVPSEYDVTAALPLIPSQPLVFYNANGPYQASFPTLIFHARTAQGAVDEVAIVIGLSEDNGPQSVKIHCDTYHASAANPVQRVWSFPGSSDGTLLPPFAPSAIIPGPYNYESAYNPTTGQYAHVLAYEFMLNIEPNGGAPIGFIGYVNCKDVSINNHWPYMASWSASPPTASGPQYPVAQINKGTSPGSFSWQRANGPWGAMMQTAGGATWSRSGGA